MAVVGMFVLCLSTLFLLLAPSSGVSIQSDIISKCDDAKGPDEQCSIVGDGDFYGLGVRIGIYASWFASWVSNSFLLDAREICQSLDTNASFLFAIAVAVATYSMSGNIRIIDALILLLLSFGYLLSVMTIWGYRTKPANRHHFGGWGTHFRLVLVNAISAYGIWFWGVGMTYKLPKCNTREQCGGLKLWILVQVPIAGAGIRNLFLAFSCICGAYYFAMFLAAVLAFVKLLRETSDNNWRDCRKSFSRRLREQIAKVDPWPLNLPERTRSTIAFWTFVWLVFAIASIEMTLQINHVTGPSVQTFIANAGQFIPLVVGGCTLLRVLWKVGLLGLPFKLLMTFLFPDVKPECPSTTSRNETMYSAPHERTWWWWTITTWLPWLCVFRCWRHAGRRSPMRRKLRDSSSGSYGFSSYTTETNGSGSSPSSN
ncbi:uncharacterized protein Z520_00589 [Fonsecaea multimorphosa CBS 102226]|uniref:Autophagy-related protein n=1 Tax=Fonsecaea multimorphosa CBS 102226 TaxID=1442371 RepID=A0A0D2J3D1_9EURO|nr:uncharacterized protein Z520_00589 [Fonsecaea multimorphosa CBS 102226]KIY03897.1 hypothetical protein Z520_00589 [Fonsecaea multimorphosa CBS 102226]OAL32158.1 hypothetical protein AYO22_00608 [Fonsecaea multimorphosa]